MARIDGYLDSIKSEFQSVTQKIDEHVRLNASGPLPIPAQIEDTKIGIKMKLQEIDYMHGTGNRMDILERGLIDKAQKLEAIKLVNDLTGLKGELQLTDKAKSIMNDLKEIGLIKDREGFIEKKDLIQQKLANLNEGVSKLQDRLNAIDPTVSLPPEGEMVKKLSISEIEASAYTYSSTNKHLEILEKRRFGNLDA